MSTSKKNSGFMQDKKKWWNWYHDLKLIVGTLALAAIAYIYFSPAPPPTLEQYATAARARTGGEVKVIRSGSIDLDGFRANCAKTPLVLNNNFEDHAAAWPQSRFIIINAKYFAALPKVQKLFTFYHECGHIAGLKSELDADCYGIKQGRKLGWLDQKGLDQLCAYWRPKKGDKTHPPGPKRCERMIACFKE